MQHHFRQRHFVRMAAVCMAGVVLLVPASRVFADPLPVALTPTRFEFAANPGQTLTGTLEFWNGTDAFLPIQLVASDFEPQGEAGHVAVGTTQAPENSLKDWITPVLRSLAVAPKQSIHLDFLLAIPQRADPGTHWGVILVKSQPGEGGGGSAIQAWVGAIVLLQVYGDVKEAMRLESFEAPRFLEAVPVSFAMRLRNEGTVHLKPAGSITVRNIFRKEVAHVALPEWNVLPGAVRKFEVSTGDDYWLGRYTAEIDATYGRDRHIIQGSAEFWVVPWKKLTLELGIAALFLLFVVLARGRFRAAWHVLRTGEEEPPPAPP